MSTKPLAPICICLTALALSLVSGCSTPPSKTTVTKINRMSASDMEQLSHIGNVWILKNTEKVSIFTKLRVTKYTEKV